jgi:hypothetical protein
VRTVNEHRRLPNPWVAIPTLVAAVIGAVLGWTVTTVQCLPESCSATAALFAGLGALATGAGVLVVVVLAYRSLGEWRRGRGGQSE